MTGRYIIGVDLGTTNSVIAYQDRQDNTATIHMLSIPQLVKPGKVEACSMLPSFIYLPAEHEIKAKNLQLPWGQAYNYCVGEFARQQGSKVPNRLISSAKSWLSHRGVDRKKDLLPFQAGEEIPKISPLEASSRYLLHLKEAWNYTMGKNPEEAFENQSIYLTVPASFDAVARDLTIQAAHNVGLQVTLLEEPQAAFYAWLHDNENKWRDSLKVGDLILIVDIGGGTNRP